MFSTRDPPSVQRIPWPSVDDENNEEFADDGQPSKALEGHHTWVLNDEELPWLVNANGQFHRHFRRGTLLTVDSSIYC